jgi:hypothetical protein
MAIRIAPQTSLFLACAAVATLTACRTRTFHSGSKNSEAPNVANKPQTLGITGDMSWETLKARTKGEANRPWSDTYWPLYEKGTAHRWVSNNYNLSNPRPTFDSIWQQIEEFQAITKEGDRAKLNALSPAEKYDWLVPTGRTLDAATLKDLQANHKAFAEDPAIKTLLKQRNTLTQKADELAKQAEVVQKEMNALAKGMLKLTESGATPETNPRLKEMQEKAVTLGDRLDKLDVEYRRIDMGINEIRPQIESLSKRYVPDMGSLSARIGSVYPMLADGWRVWSHYAGTFEGSWTWMGHCHGWAAAALYEATPKHSVLVKRGGKEILFTEGDIRGLLTKLWADQPPSDVLFASERCNSESYDTDKLGRVVDGLLCLGASGETCTSDANASVLFIKNNMTGMVSFTDTPKGRKTRFARLDQELPNDHYRVTVFNSLEEANSDSSSGKPGVMHMTASCRDTNPMLLHLAMTKLIFEQKTGFVIDVTRTSEVWNQPAYKYALDYLPLKLKDGTMSKAGELVSVDTIADPMKSYRARGTRFLIQVKANLTYGLEAGPIAQWTDSDNAEDSKTFAYTLEFDKNQKLIGGEWGLVPNANPDVSELEARAFMSGEAPDFLWRYKPGAKPKSGRFDYSIVSKIHQCSLAAGEKTATFAPFGSLKYTECVIP